MFIIPISTSIVSSIQVKHDDYLDDETDFLAFGPETLNVLSQSRAHAVKYEAFV